jgi:5-methylcytosine-specific restriction endonuclease McrA
MAQRNPEMRRASQRAYRERHCERLLQEARDRMRAKRLADPLFRTRCREASKRRKALLRSLHAMPVTPTDIRTRFAEFGGRCAYCGSAGDLHMDHFLPISRGGPHTLGNLLPACGRCNINKGSHDPEAWFRRQPSFTPARWRRILRALGKGEHQVQQLPLL